VISGFGGGFTQNCRKLEHNQNRWREIERKVWVVGEEGRETCSNNNSFSASAEQSDH
jgi:hypothetical protein